MTRTGMYDKNKKIAGILEQDPRLNQIMVNTLLAIIVRV